MAGLLNNKYRHTSVKSVPYNYAFPFEYILNYSVPQYHHWIQKRSFNDAFYKLSQWSGGNGPIVRRLRRDMGDGVDTAHENTAYICNMSVGCRGCFTVSYFDGSNEQSQGMVVRSDVCNCVEQWTLSTLGQSWKLLCTVKYEDEKIAFGRLTWFFGSRYIFPPIFKTMNDRSDHIFDGLAGGNLESDSSIFIFQYKEGTDGGVRICDTLNYQTRCQKKHCILCKGYVGTEEEGHIMFELDCSRKHTLCDGCVKMFFGRRSKKRFVTSEHIETGLLVCFGRSCDSCGDPVSGKLRTSFDDFEIVNAAIPVLHLGEKPIYSQPLYDSFQKTYHESIDWFVVAVYNCRREKRFVEGHIKYWKRQINLAIKHNLDLDEIPIHRQIIKRCKKRLKKTNHLVSFLGKKIQFVKFLFDQKENIPCELLDSNSGYFENILEKELYEELSGSDAFSDWHDLF